MADSRTKDCLCAVLKKTKKSLKRVTGRCAFQHANLFLLTLHASKFTSIIFLVAKMQVLFLKGGKTFVVINIWGVPLFQQAHFIRFLAKPSDCYNHDNLHISRGQ